MSPSIIQILEELSAYAQSLLGEGQRRSQAFVVRLNAALFQKYETSFLHPVNNDELLYADRNYIGNYTKALPHNSLGEVDPPAAYRSLRDAIRSGQFADFEAIPLGGSSKLTSPLAAFAFELEGADSHALTMRVAPAFNSAEEASEMAEVYWQALTRDVPFGQYATDPLTMAAATDLSTFSDFRGPKQGSQVTPATLFRDKAPGNLVGSYVSQFLWLDVPYGIAAAFPAPPGGGVTVPSISQIQPFAKAGQDYMIARPEWLNIINGGMPVMPPPADPPHYIRNNRDLAEFVHRDYPFLTFVNACLILLGFGRDALNLSNPYLSATKQQGFVTFGASDILDLVARVANEALKAAWYQKWIVHRRLRPEEFGGWVDNQLKGLANYPIHPELLNSPVLQRVFANSSNQSYLLPIAFPEGSPTHPAYPSGHATYAGACVTVLKALFRETFPIPNPMEASDDGLVLNPYTGPTSTIGGELNKLAANIAYARNAAGVHWRTDASEGLKLGEQVAIRFLQDRKTLYREPLAGLSFTGFDGSTKVI
jgi:membrane-associated phospholipid phosphatase